MSELTLNIDGAGKITREQDGKHLATVTEDGKVKYENPAYAKGQYLQSIEEISTGFVPSVDTLDEDPEEELGDDEVTEGDPRIHGDAPPTNTALGSYSAAWINFDNENLSDDDFGKKYQKTAQCQLDFIARRPHLFAKREELEERLATLATA